MSENIPKWEESDGYELLSFRDEWFGNCSLDRLALIWAIGYSVKDLISQTLEGNNSAVWEGSWRT